MFLYVSHFISVTSTISKQEMRVILFLYSLSEAFETVEFDNGQYRESKNELKNIRKTSVQIFNQSIYVFMPVRFATVLQSINQSFIFHSTH